MLARMASFDLVWIWGFGSMLVWWMLA